MTKVNEALWRALARCQSNQQAHENQKSRFGNLDLTFAKYFKKTNRKFKLIIAETLRKRFTTLHTWRLPSLPIPRLSYVEMSFYPCGSPLLFQHSCKLMEHRGQFGPRYILERCARAILFLYRLTSDSLLESFLSITDPLPSFHSSKLAT